MSVQLVPVRTTEPGMWVSTASRCFHCGTGFTPGELAVTWSPNDDSGPRYWHESPCAARWAAAFMRDVWEATHAATHPDDDRGRFAEPDWRSGQ